MRDREAQRHWQREKQAPCREPNMGLDPGSPGSHPGLKTAPNRWATRAAQYKCILRVKFLKKKCWVKRHAYLIYAYIYIFHYISPNCQRSKSSPVPGVSLVLGLFYFFIYLKNILFIYSWETHTERERERERQRHRQRETQVSFSEPNVGFDPGSPGSRPGPKAGAKPLRHPGIPRISFHSIPL